MADATIVLPKVDEFPFIQISFGHANVGGYRMNLWIPGAGSQWSKEPIGDGDNTDNKPDFLRLGSRLPNYPVTK